MDAISFIPGKWKAFFADLSRVNSRNPKSRNVAVVRKNSAYSLNHAPKRLVKCDLKIHVGSISLPCRLGALLPDRRPSLTEKIQALDQQVEQITRTDYPETGLLRQVSGVGPLFALTFVLTVEDRERFQKSRDVGCYVGLRPRQSDSGESEPQLRISKEGDPYLRKLLVQGAHCIMGRRGPDTDLKRWGLKLSARGGKNAKKRAVVAVARKLAILLHRLWVTGEVYEPLRNNQAGPPVKEIEEAAA